MPRKSKTLSKIIRGEIEISTYIHFSFLPTTQNLALVASEPLHQAGEHFLWAT